MYVCMYVCMVLGWWEAWHFGLLTNYCATIYTPPSFSCTWHYLIQTTGAQHKLGKVSHIDATYCCLFPLGEK